jgi:hypothetical protein
LSMSAGSGWLIRASGSPTDLPRVVVALAGGGDLSAAVDGGSLYLRSLAIDRIEKQADAEWAAYELVRLISAAVQLRSIAVFLEFQSIEAQTDALILNRETTQAHRNGSEELSVAKVMNAAQHRGHVRSAILAYADGGAEGLFKAYEALTYELMDTQRLDYAGGIGTREWLIQQGWVTEPEEASFLDTVLHYGRQNSAPSFAPASPIEAQRLVGRLLNKWIEHISLP